MKKALIITVSPNHTYGGTEIYAGKLVNILKSEGWDITEFSYDIRNEKSKIKSSHKIIYPKNKYMHKSLFLTWINFIKIKHELNKFKKNNKFDLIINDTIQGFWWEYVPDNEILIQHNDIDFYNFKFVCQNKFIAWLISFLVKIFSGYKDQIKTHKRIVFYDETNKEYASKFYKKDFHESWCINLSRFTKDQIQKVKYATRNKIVYVGRLDKCQKNINFLIKLSKYLDHQICVYGKGNLERKIRKQKNMKYCGVVDNKEVQNIFSQYLSSILVSNFEGASFSSIESLSSSTQCILRDTFLCAKTLTENNTGLLLDKNISPKKCAKKINSYLSNCNIKEQCNKAKKLAIKYYTDDQFEKKWRQLIRQF